MKVTFITLSILAVAFISCFSHGETNDHNIRIRRPALISVHIKPGGSIPFNFFDVYTQQIYFKNPFKKDTIIIREIPIDKPLFLHYGNFLVLPDGPVFHTYSLLLFPGDTVLLKQGIDDAISIQYSSGYQDFIDSLILIPKDFYWHNLEEPQQKLIKEIGLNGIVKQIESRFRKNELSISDLNLSDVRANLLRKLNSNIKYTVAAHLLADPAIQISNLTDSLYDDMYLHIGDIRSIDAVNHSTIYGAIIAYNAKKQNKNIDKNDVWACVVGVDEKLKQTDLYRDYLISIVAGGFVATPEKIVEMNRKLQALHTQSPFLDTIYRLTNILSGTFTNFNEARKKLKTFCNGRYSFIIENDEKSANHEKKSIDGLAPVTLYNFAGNQFDLKQVITNSKHKLTVVDFWASWCIPCINEMPALQKAENKLKGKSIQFVAISIDKEEAIAKWIEAAKKNNLFTKPFQYRLANFKDSPLTKLINLRNIPRYLLIDNHGNILDDDFYRPSDKRFELELLKYLD
ncbi:TlpA family protein disulfide reductase [Arcticibacter tournemirensis]|uniref:TlpA family protein disulfide reductase n=1 Tax=Arcticibacter tournemirensis TaxID=699437 RepID=A0A4Q0MC29_9SPHI|nr:TlpA disulfide reductase family protein [Arcticibacter tournemirensis]RXF70745.1 TlpA family protein disulfide reductase [Arcticibacter tournemirensis]